MESMDTESVRVEPTHTQKVEDSGVAKSARRSAKRRAVSKTKVMLAKKTAIINKDIVRNLKAMLSDWEQRLGEHQMSWAEIDNAVHDSEDPPETVSKLQRHDATAIRDLLSPMQAEVKGFTEALV